MSELSYELRKCRTCSCSRCHLAGTQHCYVEVAIRELTRYEQAFNALDTYIDYLKEKKDDH